VNIGYSLGLAMFDLRDGHPTAAQHRLDTLDDQQAEHVRLVLELLRVVATLRLGARPSRPSIALRAAMRDEKSPNHDLLRTVSEAVRLTDRERRRLALDRFRHPGP
jgi:hypothetical protein